MKSRKHLKGRTLADHELKAVQGGTTTPGDQSTDARAVVIDTEARVQVIETGAS